MPSNFTRAGPALWAPRPPADFLVMAPLMKPIRYLITGVTKDSTGTPLGGCAVQVYETLPGIMPMEPGGRLVNMGTSDANGNYSLEVHSLPGCRFRVDAYKAGAPDVAGTTVNTLTPVAT